MNPSDAAAAAAARQRAGISVKLGPVWNPPNPLDVFYETRRGRVVFFFLGREAELWPSL